MITITVELLHGWARAAGVSDEALMGSGGRGGEWPLSPARLFAALVAGGGTGQHRRVSGDDSELLALESAEPPTMNADPLSDVAFAPLNERFVVLDQTATAAVKKRGVDPEPSVQNYPFRASRTHRPGTRLVPRTPSLSYTWPALTLAAKQLVSLRERAARIGYLGASDAPAWVYVDDAVPSAPTARWEPDPDGAHAVSVPFSGSLEALDASYESFLKHQPTASSQLPRELVRYRSPDEAVEPDGLRPIRTWLRFDNALPAHRVLAVGEALKGLVLAAFEKQGFAGDAPPVLTGHGLPQGSDQARYWPLPSVGHERSDGRIFGACIQLPPDTDPEIVQKVRLATAAAELRLPGGRLVRLEAGNSKGAWSADPRRWRRQSTTWVSASPVVHERFRKGGATAEDVALWCRNAGVPTPIGFATSRAPMIPGAADLRPDQVHRRGKGGPKYPYEHLKLFFEKPVRGPFALGRLRSYGVGLMVPVDASGSGVPASGANAENTQPALEARR